MKKPIKIREIEFPTIKTASDYFKNILNLYD